MRLWVRRFGGRGCNAHRRSVVDALSHEHDRICRGVWGAAWHNTKCIWIRIHVRSSIFTFSTLIGMHPSIHIFQYRAKPLFKSISAIDMTHIITRYNNIQATTQLTSSYKHAARKNMRPKQNQRKATRTPASPSPFKKIAST